MCFSISFNIDPNKYLNRYQYLLEEDTTKLNYKFESFYFLSAFDFPVLPIITKKTIILASWGLIPSWLKDNSNIKNFRTKTLNARFETLKIKPSFKHLINSKRGLLGVTGFFEWRNFNNKKYPYFIKHKYNELFSIGVLYDYNENSENTNPNTKYSFSLITVNASKLLEKIHNTKKRMPLLIKQEMEKFWLNTNFNINQINLNDILIPDSELEYYTVSNIVNYPNKNRNNSLAIQKHFYPELPPL